MNEFKLNQTVEIVAAELEYFHHQNGGNYLLPTLQKEETISDLNKYSVTDGDSRAAILFRPIENGSTLMSINPNDTERFAWILGDISRSKLGETTVLGAEPSARCENFCNQFMEHLAQVGFLDTNQNNKIKGGRPRHEEDDWAREHVLLETNINEIFEEWLARRKQKNRPELADAYDSFKKVMSKSS